MPTQISSQGEILTEVYEKLMEWGQSNKTEVDYGKEACELALDELDNIADENRLATLQEVKQFIDAMNAVISDELEPAQKEEDSSSEDEWTFGTCHFDTSGAITNLIEEANSIIRLLEVYKLSVSLTSKPGLFSTPMKTDDTEIPLLPQPTIVAN